MESPRAKKLRSAEAPWMKRNIFLYREKAGCDLLLLADRTSASAGNLLGFKKKKKSSKLLAMSGKPTAVPREDKPHALTAEWFMTSAHKRKWRVTVAGDSLVSVTETSIWWYDPTLMERFCTDQSYCKSLPRLIQPSETSSKWLIHLGNSTTILGTSWRLP